MAQKRMFSLQIVDSDAFLDMPQSSQLLYYHLCMRADDEGFVGNPKKIMRIVGTQEDDLKILLAKRFILTFKTGVVVIKHWLIHNTIRMDRFNPTTYQTEKQMLITKENKAYTELATTRQPDDNQLVTQVKLSKVKLSKVNIDATDKTVAGIPEVFKVFEEKNPAIKRMYGNTTQRGACERLITKFGLEKVVGYAKFAIKVLGMPYSPRITTPYLLETKWADLEAFYHESIGKQNAKGKEILGL